MHRPAMNELLKQGESYYSLVIAVAKRARDIADEAEEEGEIIIEKPVKLAIDDFSSGTCKLIEKNDIGVSIE